VTTTELDPRLHGFTADELLEMHERMYRIRRFEEHTSRLYADGEVPGFVHLSIGQEATAVGACWPLRTTDGIVSTHRGHGHSLAKGAAVGPMFAELFAKETGTCRGRGGSMHIAEIGVGVYGANGIVGAGLPIATGIAHAFRQQGRDDVMVAFFGDGAIAQGAFHEAVNLAALWRLPVVFLCENNGYAEFSPTESQHPVPVAQRALAYGIEAHTVDGDDVLAVAALLGSLVEDRSAGLPVLVESVTHRVHGHYEGDPQRYREGGEVEGLAATDPLVRSAALLADLGLDGARVEREQAVDAELATAIDAARAAPQPDPATLHDFVVVERAAWTDEGTELEGEPTYRIMDAVHDALDAELADDPSVFVAGIDVGRGGNIFGLTRGLIDAHPGRVLDTPISETALMGLAVGGAMAGAKPVVEVMYLDFIGVCFDQIMNQAAKLHFMTGGAAPMSLVIRTQFGAGRASGAQHSQSLEALLAHLPGLTVVMPSNPADAYGLLRAAIQDPNPVLFIEHRLQYGKKGPRPPRDHLVPIGVAAHRRSGGDLTVVSWSRMVDDVLAASEVLAGEGIQADVVELRTISPLDEAAVLQSVERTGRLLVVHEAAVSGGFGAEVAARVADLAFWHLDTPVRRLGAPAVPNPYAPSLERVWLPGIDEIVAAMRELAAT
jgi:2-oxoisovalerate dehydrogenase E1 component